MPTALLPPQTNPLSITPYRLAERYVGVSERDPGHHPLIQWWLELCSLGRDQPDEVPWCSAFANGIAWELRLPRSKDAAARSWLRVGTPIEAKHAEPGFDVVILKRGKGDQPGPEVTRGATGHVGFFGGWEQSPGRVLVLGGNQGDGVCIAPFPADRILGFRRLAA